MICSVCRVDKTITLEHTVPFGRQRFTWRICRVCQAREDELAGVRAADAIVAAEKAGA